MSDISSGNDNQSDAVPPPQAPWLRAAAADLEGFDFETPIEGSNSADGHELSDLFRAAIQQDATGQAPDTPAVRLFIMLSAVTSMYFKPEDRHEPFGAMMTLTDGRRSAIPSDFCGAHVDVLAQMARRARNPVLRARLADICWLLDRKRADLGGCAIAAYVEVVRKVDSGELKLRFDSKEGALDHRVVEHLRRGLQIGRAIGWDKPETVAARELAVTLRKRATEKRALTPVLFFGRLDLSMGVSDPAEVGADIDGVLAALPGDASEHIVVELWRLAARAYHLAKRDDDKYRCQSQAAEHLVSDAENALTNRNSALLASHTLSTAIAQLHGVPSKKDRRTELRHRLIDVQARIPDEMSTFSHQMDLRTIVEKVEETFRGESLTDKLFMFAAFDNSPDPEKLVEDALAAIRQHPLQSIFSTSHLDSEGKVIHRTAGSSSPDKPDDPAVQRQIAQSEGLRRQIVAAGKIEIARQIIVSEHFLSDDLLRFLLQHSPFVPTDCVGTFSRGFLRFFQGDCTSAVYILTPLLENSLRHVLKVNGHDVTTFDDATQTQEDRTISSLFEQMRNELDAIFTTRITTDIDNVFLSKPGPHLRHSLSHGLLPDGAPYGADAIYSCWLLFRLCLLPLYRHRDQFRPVLG